jgi:chromosome segregation ATPase
MSNLPPAGTPSDRVREIEMRLWEEVGTQLKGMTDAVKDLTREIRDVRERLVRIETQDQPAKIAALETEARDLRDELHNHRQDAQAQIAGVKQDAAADVAQAKADAAADKLALEKRLTRMEVIIVPLTMIGSTLLTGIVGAIVAALSTGMFHH